MNIVYTDIELSKYTKEELLSIPNHGDADAQFNAITIVPTGRLHDSGFQMMKFIMSKDGKVVMACSGWSDVMHINGIGGYGKFGTNECEEAITKQRVRRIGWCIDCLAKSGCVRLFTNNAYCKIKDGFIGSDFIFYVDEMRNGR